MKPPTWSICPPLIDAPKEYDITGQIKDKLTVVGYLGGGKWAVECECGNFEYRKIKALRNAENRDEKCYQCRSIIPEPPAPTYKEPPPRTGCGKVVYTSQSAAKKAIISRLRKGANCGKLRAYFCKSCARWHMSSNFFGKQK